MIQTIAEFERYLRSSANPEYLYELIDGFITEKHFYTDECSTIVGLLLYWLTDYAMKQGYGLPGPSRSFRVLGDDHNVRTPNISMIVNPDVPLSREQVMDYVPEVIAEIKTPDDTIDLLRDKAEFYVANGVQLVWLLFPRQQIVEVYRPNTSPITLTIHDNLDGYDIMPEFSLPLTQLFVMKRSG